MPGRTRPGGRSRGCGDDALGHPPAARLSPAPPPEPCAAAFPPPAVAVATGGCSQGSAAKWRPRGEGARARGTGPGTPRGSPLWGRAVPPSGLADRAGPGRWAEAGPGLHRVKLCCCGSLYLRRKHAVFMQLQHCFGYPPVEHNFKLQEKMMTLLENITDSLIKQNGKHKASSIVIEEFKSHTRWGN
ncbi:mitogen-activated protein kinase kinase kinase 11-like isoform X4 [Oxyura jamaicensis]|uniref:mitogen-activated protein kinase kinase kinase 11-like isoform X4 n=2 Tax=Oxyura jamaicensis TaxID=8884 RepID=UPI0015A6E8F4|nr:mitogen-activated protein kinase kinase kinase 11-like isoform X4 [Oxyura jamaicensis]XP_035193080.1 mitogen-activated protein kinase kinase kinase 11-like isoform X4 [Oxyura jamaicensis]XP_035193081.1 mitogen-activated protein kinase kinase kinase 11-like isoform X4 [Oxyura jamaicensis]